MLFTLDGIRFASWRNPLPGLRAARWRRAIGDGRLGRRLSCNDLRRRCPR